MGKGLCPMEAKILLILAKALMNFLQHKQAMVKKTKRLWEDASLNLKEIVYLSGKLNESLEHVYIVTTQVINALCIS